MLMRATGITTPDGLRRVLDDYFAGYGPDNWAYSVICHPKGIVHDRPQPYRFEVGLI